MLATDASLTSYISALGPQPLAQRSTAPSHTIGRAPRFESADRLFISTQHAGAQPHLETVDVPFYSVPDVLLHTFDSTKPAAPGVVLRSDSPRLPDRTSPSPGPAAYSPRLPGTFPDPDPIPMGPAYFGRAAARLQAMREMLDHRRAREEARRARDEARARRLEASQTLESGHRSGGGEKERRGNKVEEEEDDDDDEEDDEFSFELVPQRDPGLHAPVGGGGFVPSPRRLQWRRRQPRSPEEMRRLWKEPLATHRREEDASTVDGEFFATQNVRQSSPSKLRLFGLRETKRSRVPPGFGVSSVRPLAQRPRASQESPGPAEYKADYVDISGLLSTHPHAPAVSLGSSTRESALSTLPPQLRGITGLAHGADSPGPSHYKPVDARTTRVHRAPAFRMGGRDPPPLEGPPLPGPGAYDVTAIVPTFGPQTADSTRPNSPRTTLALTGREFAKATEDRLRATRDVPGPNAYFSAEDDHAFPAPRGRSLPPTRAHSARPRARRSRSPRRASNSPRPVSSASPSSPSGPPSPLRAPLLAARRNLSPMPPPPSSSSSLSPRLHGGLDAGGSIVIERGVRIPGNVGAPTVVSRHRSSPAVSFARTGRDDTSKLFQPHMRRVALAERT